MTAAPRALSTRLSRQYHLAMCALPPPRLARLNPVTRRRTATWRMQGTPIELCPAPCLCADIGLAGQRRIPTDLHGQRPGGGAPARATFSWKTPENSPCQCQDTPPLHYQKSTTGKDRRLARLSHRTGFPVIRARNNPGKMALRRWIYPGYNTCIRGQSSAPGHRKLAPICW